MQEDKMGEAKIDADLNQFGSIIDGIAKKCGSLEGIGIDPEAFKADARAVIATHVNNICADKLNTATEPSKEGLS